MYVLSGFIVARSRESRHRTRELFWLAQLMNKETLSMLTDLLGGYAAQDFLQQLRISWSVGRSPSSRTARITGCGESAVCSGFMGVEVHLDLRARVGLEAASLHGFPRINLERPGL